MKKINMKHLISLSFIICSLPVSVALTGCAGEEDDIFSATAAERLNESSAKYSARLEAQPNGWAMQYYPTYENEAPYGSGYLILMDFNHDHSVKVAMDNNFSGGKYATDTSVWEVITDNGPVLSFNSFNTCMHAFSDPEDIPWTSDNEQSEGCGGDYEFIIVDAPEDASYMMLKGKKRNTYNLLTPIEEGVDYEAYLADVKQFHNAIFQENELVSNLMHFGPDSLYRMDGSNDGLPNIYPYDADAIANQAFNPFLITKRGQDYYVRFRDAFEKDYLTGELQELRYDSIAQEFVGTDCPEWRITGYDPVKFFVEKMESTNKVSLNASSVMSDKFKTYVDNVVKAITSLKMKNRAYAFASIFFAYDGNAKGYAWNVSYRVPSSSKNSNATYLMEMTNEADVVTFKYTTPYDEGGTISSVIAETLPDIPALLQVLNRSFKVTPVISKFNLSQLRFTAVDDPDLWFNVSLSSNATQTNV